MRRRDDPSDVTNAEWKILEPLIPPAHDFPPWSTVWTYFRTWRNDGTWQRMHTALRERVRVSMGREPTPSAAIIDSQSVKTSQKGGLVAMTVGRKSKGVSGICSSIRLA